MARNAAAPVANTDVQMIDIAKLAVAGVNARSIHMDKISPILLESIGHDGIRQPLIVKTHPKGFEIIDGSQRFNAAKSLGLKKLPCVVDDDANSLTSLTMNLSNRPLSQTEILLAMRSFVIDGADIATAIKMLASTGASEKYLKAMSQLELCWVEYAMEQASKNNHSTPQVIQAVAKLPSHAQKDLYDEVGKQKLQDYQIITAARSYFNGDLNHDEKKSIEAKYKELGGRIEYPLFDEPHDGGGKFLDFALVDQAFDMQVAAEVKRLNDFGFTDVRVIPGRRQSAWDQTQKAKLRTRFVPVKPEHMDQAAARHGVDDYQKWVETYEAADVEYDNGNSITNPPGMSDEEQEEYLQDCSDRSDRIHKDARLLATPADSIFLVLCTSRGVEVEGPLESTSASSDAPTATGDASSDEGDVKLTDAASGRLRHIHASMMSYLLCQDTTASFRYIAYSFYQQATDRAASNPIGMKHDYTSAPDEGYALPREPYATPRFDHKHPAICREWFMTSPMELIMEAFVWSIATLFPVSVHSKHLVDLLDTPSQILPHFVEKAYSTVAGVPEREAWFRQFPLATLRAYANNLDPELGKLLAGSKKGEAAASLAKITAGLSRSLPEAVQLKISGALPIGIDFRDQAPSDGS